MCLQIIRFPSACGQLHFDLENSWATKNDDTDHLRQFYEKADQSMRSKNLTPATLVHPKNCSYLMHQQNIRPSFMMQRKRSCWRTYWLCCSLPALTQVYVNLRQHLRHFHPAHQRQNPSLRELRKFSNTSKFFYILLYYKGNKGLPAGVYLVYCCLFFCLFLLNLN